MFTGLIESTGVVTAWRPSAKGGRLVVRARKKLSKILLGESIAVNGCCLTVAKRDAQNLNFDVSQETLRKTALGKFQKGSIVNLERAMKAGDRLGGHFVLGHVDGVGKIAAVHHGKTECWFEISYPKNAAGLLIDKGSVTVDGISLTVCDLTRKSFRVYIVPHTLKETHLSKVKIGDSVNLEFDVLGKYVQRMMEL